MAMAGFITIPTCFVDPIRPSTHPSLPRLFAVLAPPFALVPAPPDMPVRRKGACRTSEAEALPQHLHTDGSRVPRVHQPAVGPPFKFQSARTHAVLQSSAGLAPVMLHTSETLVCMCNIKHTHGEREGRGGGWARERHTDRERARAREEHAGRG